MHADTSVKLFPLTKYLSVPSSRCKFRRRLFFLIRYYCLSKDYQLLVNDNIEVKEVEAIGYRNWVFTKEIL
jgi:hypothetical protein